MGYTLFLAGYIENLHPDPSEISWRDYELYLAFLQARSEFMAERQREADRAASRSIGGRRLY